MSSRAPPWTQTCNLIIIDTEWKAHRKWSNIVGTLQFHPFTKLTVNVPILIIHGDVDQRVPPEHFEKYVDELDRAGVLYKKLILEGADHFSNTLFYHHKISLYENMLEFLGNDCGLKSDGTAMASARAIR